MRPYKWTCTAKKLLVTRAFFVFYQMYSIIFRTFAYDWSD